jgi:hypothetical protein
MSRLRRTVSDVDHIWQGHQGHRTEHGSEGLGAKSEVRRVLSDMRTSAWLTYAARPAKTPVSVAQRDPYNWTLLVLAAGRSWWLVNDEVTPAMVAPASTTPTMIATIVDTMHPPGRANSNPVRCTLHAHDRRVRWARQIVTAAISARAARLSPIRIGTSAARGWSTTAGSGTAYSDRSAAERVSRSPASRYPSAGAPGWSVSSSTPPYPCRRRIGSNGPLPVAAVAIRRPSGSSSGVL